MGVQVFWDNLPREQQDIIEEFVPFKIVERNELSTLSADLARACTPLFQSSQNDLVRRLCVQLGYIDADHEASLGGLRGDVDHDPLEFFQPSRSNPQRSRYETLFLDDDNESHALRQLFF